MRKHQPDTILHPGFVGQFLDSFTWNEEEMLGKRKERKLKDYIPFCNFTDIEESDQRKLEDIMFQLFNLTSDY